MKRGGKKGKRKGISPLIATVSLVGISVVLFGIIFLWSRGFVKEKVLKFGENIEHFCDSVSLEVTATPSQDSQDNGKLDLTLNNIGNVNIYKIRIIYHTNSGKIPKEYYAGGGEDERALPAGRLASFEVDVKNDIGYSLDEISELEVIPILEGVGEESQQPYTFPCENQKGEIML